MSATNPHASLPLFAPPRFVLNGIEIPATGEEVIEPWPSERAIVSPLIMDMPPTSKGIAGSEDGLRHAKQEAPAFVLEALGNALFSFRGTEFTSEQVRAVAERSEAVAGWLNGPTRNACFSGWFRSRIRLHKLVRVSRPPAVAQRASRRGSVLPYWRFPTP